MSSEGLLVDMITALVELGRSHEIVYTESLLFGSLGDHGIYDQMIDVQHYIDI